MMLLLLNSSAVSVSHQIYVICQISVVFLRTAKEVAEIKTLDYACHMLVTCLWVSGSSARSSDVDKVGSRREVGAIKGDPTGNFWI